ncbi:hypothetical protein T492DRAFT_992595 [Pavlovales sp. CCMP2436]|nr:hypothetical protein T492DRAFT_992595 [Pavlovales sp. CCMP2436]
MTAGRWQLRALLAVCFGTLAVHGGETSPVPVSAEMLSVLEGAGVSLREELVADVNRERPPSESIVLLGGLARLCEHDAVVRLHVASCARANATLVALLQHYEPGSFPAAARNHLGGKVDDPFRFKWAQCASSFIRAANEHPGCRLVLGRQWFVVHGPMACATSSDAASRKDATRGVVSARTIIQTVAIGRAYEWAQRFEPSARMFVRGRMEHVSCVPPIPLSPFGSELAVFASKMDSVTGGSFTSDAGALMGADAARIYFGAWRVWSPYNCSNTCWAGAGSNLADTASPARASSCTGEAPLSKWLVQSRLVPRLRSGSSLGEVEKLAKANYSYQAALGFIDSLYKAPRCLACWQTCLRAHRSPKAFACHSSGRVGQKCVVMANPSSAEKVGASCAASGARRITWNCVLSNTALTSGNRDINGRSIIWPLHAPVTPTLMPDKRMLSLKNATA